MTIAITTPGGTVIREVSSALIIGRRPGRGGVVIGPEDLTVSAKAVRVLLEGRSAMVENLSTHAPVEVHGPGALRPLQPGEKLRLVRDTPVVVPGSAHPIDITGVQRPPRPRRSRSVEATRRFLDGQRQLADTRKQALVALCLPRFDPRRWPGGLLTASQIAAQLCLAGMTTTPKEIDNKLARLRVQLGRDHDLPIGSREELADLAIRHGIVTLHDVGALRARQQRHARIRSSRGVT